MASPKPTPEEKLFAVIQGAKSPPVRKPGRGRSLAFAGQRVLALAQAADLPFVNRMLLGLMAVLVLGFFTPLFNLPSVERLIATSQPPALFRMAAPLEGLKPLEDTLLQVLQNDPFRVGSTPLPAGGPSSSTPAPDAAATLSDLRLVGIAWGEVPIAMIEQNNQTYFLKAGDSLGSFTIKEVLRDHVILRSANQDVELF